MRCNELHKTRSINQKCLVKLEEEEEDAHNINARCTKMNWRYQLNLYFFLAHLVWAKDAKSACVFLMD